MHFIQSKLNSLYHLQALHDEVEKSLHRFCGAGY